MNLKKFIRFSVCSLVVSLAFVAQKASCLPFWDSANYPINANLSGLTNVEGNVWAPCVLGGQIQDVQVVSEPLTYPGLECSASNAFSFGDTGSSGITERIPIHPPIYGENTLYTNATGGYVITNAYIMTNGTIYYSFLLSVNSLGGLTTGGWVCGFNTLMGPQSGQPSVAGARIYMVTNASGGYLIGIGKNPSGPTSATYLTTPLSVGSTYFVVCSYTFNNVTNNDDVAQIWLNPDPSTFGMPVPPPPSATNTSGTDLISNNANQLESFIFREGNSQIPWIYAADLRIGYCWGCVTPPANNPAPKVAALSIANVSTNQAVVSFQTNTPCFRLMTSTNIGGVSNSWYPVSTSGTVEGTNFVVTNTVAAVSTVTSNVAGGVTNFTTNTSLLPTYYQAKTFAN
jgi:hypothetical protein